MIILLLIFVLIYFWDVKCRVGIYANCIAKIDIKILHILCRTDYMHIKQYILIITSILLLACQKDNFTFDNKTDDNRPYVVGFWAGGNVSGSTRTAINDDGKSISWEQGDNVALWALQGSSYIFQNQPFNLWFRTANNSQAFFASTLATSMPDGEYTYYACHPTPTSVNGTTATFTIPSTQDGKMSGGADIMVAQRQGPALKKLYNPDAENPEDKDFIIDEGLSLNMRHLIHALRFYVPQAKWGFPTDETVERIVFTMPSTTSGINATGTVTADVASASGGLTMTNNGGNTISLNLREPFGPSVANSSGIVEFDYAAVAIMPATYTGELTAKVYSQTKASQVTISGISRTMDAGHITPVSLDCSTVTDRPKISFRIASNNLGEKPYKITLTSSDSNTKWKAGDDHEYEYYTGSESTTIAVGNGFDIYYDEEVLSTISGKTVTVTYESKSAIVTETITMPTMNIGTSYNINFNIPYLFAENFDNITTTNEKVEDTTGAALDNYGLIGWSGNRWATDKLIRLATYIGTTAANGTDIQYSRVDTPCLYGIKDGKTVKVNVSFNLGLTRISGNGLWGIGAWDIQARCYFGKSTYDESNPYPSGGTIAIAGNIGGINKPDTTIQEITDCTMSEYNESKMKNYSYNIDCKNTSRLSWVNDYLLHKGAPAAKTVYVYIDNIKVQIASE